MMTIPTPTVWTPPWYATIPKLLCVLAVPAFPQNMMMMYQPFPGTFVYILGQFPYNL